MFETTTLTVVRPLFSLSGYAGGSHCGGCGSRFKTFTHLAILVGAGTRVAMTVAPMTSNGRIGKVDGCMPARRPA